MKIDHINITVPNLEKSVDFYINVLGFKQTNRFSNGVMDFVFLTDGNTTYELVENTCLSQGVFDHIAYVSTDIEKDFAHFDSLNLTTTPIGFVPFLFENGVRYFFIKGSNGERIEYIQII